MLFALLSSLRWAVDSFLVAVAVAHVCFAGVGIPQGLIGLAAKKQRKEPKKEEDDKREEEKDEA